MNERTVNSTALHIMLSLMIHVGVVEHGLGGDASDVKAGSAEGAAFLYAGSLGWALSVRIFVMRLWTTLRPSWAALIAATYPPGPGRDELRTRRGKTRTAADDHDLVRIGRC